MVVCLLEYSKNKKRLVLNSKLIEIFDLVSPLFPVFLSEDVRKNWVVFIEGLSDQRAIETVNEIGKHIPNNESPDLDGIKFLHTGSFIMSLLVEANA